MAMTLEILTPEKCLFEGEVSSVNVPGTEGGFEILNNHAPIIATLMTKGEVRLVQPGQKEMTIAIKGGVVEVLRNHIVILTEA
jgi:F-type H+-transporting ATPase subunit epsilon